MQVGLGNPDAFHVADVQRYRSGRRNDTRWYADCTLIH